MMKWQIKETLETLEPEEQKKFLNKLLEEAKALKKKYKKDATGGTLLAWVPAALGTASLICALLGASIPGIALAASGIVSMGVNEKFIFDNVINDKEYYLKDAPMMAKVYEQDIKYLK